ncbi:MAG TPA: non-homologous end-joining DNA ligase [Actinopolymorphaceae bacterium]
MTRVPAEEIEVGGRTVRVSNPDKVYFRERGFTKRDVVNYVVSVADGLLRATYERPTTLERWPGGVFEGAKLSTRADGKGDAFYQKRIPKGAPDYVETARITFPSGRTADEVCPTEPAVLAWAANLGTLTFHPWPVRKADVDRPDELRIDLDPQPGTDFTDAVVVAHEVRALLDEAGLIGYPKTSGGRGVHVYVAIEPRWTFVEVRRAAIALAREMERRRPDKATAKWWKEERGERVFLDFNQMARDRTIASAYSIRPRPHAPVSAPVTWDELDDVEPEDFDIATMPKRFAEVGDLEAGLHDRPGSLETLLEWSARDERAGEGDMPYPPDYPKMPGEPRRVQPSRARRDPEDQSTDVVMPGEGSSAR